MSKKNRQRPKPKAKSKEKEEPKKVVKPVKRDEDDHSGHRMLARKFYEIMRALGPGPFVDCFYLQDKFKEHGLDLRGNDHLLWRIWRQAEHDFPGAIDFIPQSSLYWTAKPSGWRYIGPPQYENRRKKRLR